MSKRKTPATRLLDTWMLVKKGKVQRLPVTMNGRPVLAWPVAQREDLAKRLANWAKGSGIRAARIGSVEGETLEGHVRLAIDDGCAMTVCAVDFDAAGVPVWGFLPLPEGGAA